MSPDRCVWCDNKPFTRLQDGPAAGLKQEKEMKKYKYMLAGAALLAVPALCSAALVTSFETGDLDGWTAGTINGSTTTVSMDHASDGSYGADSSFTVAASMAGDKVFALLNQDARSFMNAGSTALSMDVYSDWANANSWGVYANEITLILNYEGGWKTVAPTAGSLVNGSFQTLTFDMTPWAATITDAGLGYSQVGIAWHIGTWAGDGYSQDPVVYTDNGTQTLAVDNIQVIPEPTTLGMATFAGAGILFIRRRLKR